MSKQVIVHYYSRGMAYTGCYMLPNKVEAATANKDKVTCPKCLERIKQEEENDSLDDS